MTLEDAPADPAPLTRRARRETGPTPTAPDAAPVETDAAASVGPVETAQDVASAGNAAPSPAPARALGWVSASTVSTPIPPEAGELPAASEPAEPDLLADAPRRSPFRASILVPILVALLLFGGYAGTTLLWPLHAIPPQIEATPVQPVPAPVTEPAWPAQGNAAIRVGGISGDAVFGEGAPSIASITKVVTALLVLDEMPLAVGEQGPAFAFTFADRNAYWAYRANGESALDVPVGGTLSQYQLLQGMLIGSANNYADRLAGNLWPTDAVFAGAANEWLAAHGLPDIRVVDPSGIDPGNFATPAALLNLAERALADPVIAEIVATPSVEIPGAGVVTNTNGLLADPGVVGIKTGSLDTFGLLSAKDITVGDVPVRLYAAVLGQPDDAARVQASRDIYTRMEEELQLQPSVTEGTLAGQVTTRWGEEVDVVTTDDASVVLWNGGTASTEVAFDLGTSVDAGSVVGTMIVRGPLNSVEVPLVLGEDIEEPGIWWRLTHPLDLFGLNG